MIARDGQPSTVGRKRAPLRATGWKLSDKARGREFKNGNGAALPLLLPLNLWYARDGDESAVTGKTREECGEFVGREKLECLLSVCVREQCPEDRPSAVGRALHKPERLFVTSAANLSPFEDLARRSVPLHEQ